MLILALGMVPSGAFAAISDTSTAGITVTNAVSGDKLEVYKVVDISYDSVSNTVSHAFNADFRSYFDSRNVTVEELAAFDDAQLKNTLADLPRYIRDNKVGRESYDTVGDSGTIEFTGMPMGGYFIMPTSTTSVYQLMFQKIEPAVTDGEYTLSGVTFAAKHKSVGITKTADKTSVTKNEKVRYTVEADIPTYELAASSKAFSIVDVLATGLRLDQDSIKVKFQEGAEVASGMYSIENKSNTGFTLSVSNGQYNEAWLAQAGKKLVVEYTATFANSSDTDSVVAAFGNKAGNNVTYTYSSYPYSGITASKTASVDVNSFIIQVDKYEKNRPDIKLAGARFQLYKATDDGDVTIPHTSVKGKLMETLTTDDSGAAQFRKYEANGDRYDYYLVETAAPSGYNLLPDAVKVNFTESQTDQTTGIYTVEVANSTGLQLPVTGDRGTMIMTLGGIILMASAVALLAAARRRKNA